jgi:hypothetical protein
MAIHLKMRRRLAFPVFVLSMAAFLSSPVCTFVFTRA